MNTGNASRIEFSVATRAIPVIIISGVSDDFRTFISSRKHVPPPDGYLGKPVDAAGLPALVAKLMPAWP